MNYPEDFINKIICGDCLEVMKGIPDGVIDMVLCDLPYGVTACSWDVTIPPDRLWIQYKRIMKDVGCVALFGGEPFSSHLRMSNLGWYKYDWIWEKSRPSNPNTAKYVPMRYTENISIFYNRTKYFPQMWESGRKSHDNRGMSASRTTGYTRVGTGNISSIKYPRNIIKVKSLAPDKNNHPTQKPVALFEYLIKTYTNEGDLVLDNCVGSGTTAVACKNTGRDFIGIDISDECCRMARGRLEDES